MTNANARNWSSWCRACNAQRQMDRNDREKCGTCGKRFDAWRDEPKPKKRAGK